MRIDLEDVEREVIGRRRAPPSSTEPSHCSKSWPGSHIIKSRLTLSNPAAACQPHRFARPLGRVEAARAVQFGIAKRLDTEAQAIDTCVAEAVQPSPVDSLGVGLERDLRVDGEAERATALVDNRAESPWEPGATACRRRSTACQEDRACSRPPVCRSRGAARQRIAPSALRRTGLD